MTKLSSLYENILFCDTNLELKLVLAREVCADPRCFFPQLLRNFFLVTPTFNSYPNFFASTFWFPTSYLNFFTSTFWFLNPYLNFCTSTFWFPNSYPNFRTSTFCNSKIYLNFLIFFKFATTTPTSDFYLNLLLWKYVPGSYAY